MSLSFLHQQKKRDRFLGLVIESRLLAAKWQNCRFCCFDNRTSGFSSNSHVVDLESTCHPCQVRNMVDLALVALVKKTSNTPLP